MKKTTTIFIIASIAFFSCNKNLLKLYKKDPDTVSNFNSSDSIPRVTALAMIDHFRDHYNDNTLIGTENLDTLSVSLHKSDLNKIFHFDSVSRIRFISAAYLPSNPDPAKQNKVTVLLQIKQGYYSNYLYYDMELLGAICPPPPGCSVE